MTSRAPFATLPSSPINGPSPSGGLPTIPGQPFTTTHQFPSAPGMQQMLPASPPQRPVLSQSSPIAYSKQHMKLGPDPQPPKNFTSIDIEKQPWIHKGYPALSEWMSSDNDFFVLRKFGKLNARVALMMQDHISHLEEELDYLDEECRQLGVNNGTFRHDKNERRKQILEQLARKLERYNTFVHYHSELKARPDASNHQVRNVKNWFDNNKPSISPKETEFIEHDGDLMALVPKPQVPLKRFIGQFDFIRKLCCFRERRPHGVQSGPTIYNNDSRIDKVVTCITMSFGLAMLIGPLWLLGNRTADSASWETRLIIISCFIVGFTAILSTVTTANSFETLAATAAYSAVLMVFVQIQGIT